MSRDNKVEYIIFEYDTYKSIINYIIDFEVLYEIYIQNKILVLIEMKYVPYYVRHLSRTHDVKINNSPKQTYSLCLKNPSSHVLDLVGDMLPTSYQNITIESLQENIIKQYDILFKQHLTHMNYSKN